MKKDTYGKETLQLFWQSFTQLDMRYPITMLYDVVFYVIFGVLIQLLGVFGATLTSLGNAINLDAAQASTEAAQAALAQTQKLLISTALGGLVFVLLVILAFSILKGLIWLTIFKKKPTKRYFLKAFLGNLLWFAIWITPWFLLLTVLQEAARATIFGNGGFAAAILILVILHPLIIFNYSLTKDKKHNIKPALGKIFSIGYAKIHHFIIPYVLGAIVYLVLAYVAIFINTNLISNETTALGVLILFAIIYLNWLRLYIASVINKIS